MVIFRWSETVRGRQMCGNLSQLEEKHFAIVEENELQAADID